MEAADHTHGVPLEVTRTAGPLGRIRLAMAGEIDMSNVGRLQQILVDLLNDPAVSSVELDMNRLTFIDSTGMRELVTAKQLADERGVALRVVNPHENVLRVFQILRMEEEFMAGEPSA